MNTLLNRDHLEKQMIQFFNYFEKNKNNEMTCRCIYVYGPPGCGKTTFVNNILTQLEYDILTYNAGDIRNKSIIDNITISNMSDHTILSMFFNKPRKKIAVVMDEMEGMNNGDKGGINSLIKIIRPKKTKKQKLEEITHVPIICIGSLYMDKKIRELMKYCLVIELKRPTNANIISLIHNDSSKIINYISCDLKRWEMVNCLKSKITLTSDIVDYLLPKVSNEDSKLFTLKLLNNSISRDNHERMVDTDRTIIGLLFHENIIDILEKSPKKKANCTYLEILNNMCFADYVDRITFQKQIWQFNEMSSLIKTFYNNHIYHNSTLKKYKHVNEIRFTKVLTKYSTEYNNSLFLNHLSQELIMDKKDMISYLCHLKTMYSDSEIVKLHEHTDITLLDIQRFFRYIDRCLG